MGITAPGRMINSDISRSKRIASLSPEALSLFCLLIPHFNAHGKMLANPYLIKGLVCPYIEWISVEDVELLLMEISDKTNVKYWKDDSGEYLQSMNWQEHQKLKTDRLGKDYFPDCPAELPDYSRTTPGLLPPEVEVEVEVEDKKFLATAIETETYPDGEGEKKAAAAIKPMPVSECRKLYMTYFNTIQVNSPIVTILQDICRLYPPESIKDAFQAVPGANARNINWVVERLKNRSRDIQEPDYDAIVAELKAQEDVNAT